MLELEEAIAVLTRYADKIQEVERIPLLSCVGRILAEDIVADHMQPPFPRSPLDGYAVKGKDTESAGKEKPVMLKVIGKVYAGQVFEGEIASGECVRIMTGAPIPSGADTVIRQEDTDYGKDEVLIYTSSSPYSNYCFAGEDYKEGDLLLKKDKVIAGLDLAICSSLGLTDLLVYRQPKVAVIATGDEVLLPGQELKAGKIYDSNLYYILGRMQELGIPVSYAAHSSDQASGLADRIKNSCKDMDIIITTGGVSVGEKDIMHEVLPLLGAKKLFWRVHVKPGAPTLAGMYEKTLLLCLSGNPFGAAVNFELLARPILSGFTGNQSLMAHPYKGKLANPAPKKGGVRRFLRGKVDQGLVSFPSGQHASGTISSMAGCNCLCEIPMDSSGLVGEDVWVYEF